MGHFSGEEFGAPSWVTYRGSLVGHLRHTFCGSLFFTDRRARRLVFVDHSGVHVLIVFVVFRLLLFVSLM